MLLNELPRIMITCLLITIIIELVGAIILKTDKRDLIYVLLVNTLTNPLVVSIPVYINIKYGLNARNIVLITFEIMTVLIEGLIYIKSFKKNKINPYLFSLILNACSYFIGEIINYVF